MAKKKIALLVWPIDNIGGIWNSCYHLIEGFREIDVTCVPFLMKYRGKSKSMRVAENTKHKIFKSGWGYRISKTQFNLHLADDLIIPYDDNDIGYCREILSDFDAVIVRSFPTMAKRQIDDRTWPKILKMKKKRVVGVIPDALLLKSHAWVAWALEHLYCLVGIHPASYKTLGELPCRRVMILNPYDLTRINDDVEDRKDRIMMSVWFKKWKRMHEFLRAVPFVDPSIAMAICGGGIEYHYLTSENKCPDEYYWHKKDPDCQKSFVGRKIWDVAEEHPGFWFLRFQPEDIRNGLFSKSKFVADFSYHYDWGEHFNRVFIEAMIQGCVPIARPYGISDNAEGKGEVFSGKNCILIPEESSPMESAEIMNEAMEDDKTRLKIIKRNDEMLPIFARSNIAKQYYRLLFTDREDIGFYESIENGARDLPENVKKKLQKIRR